MEQETDSKMRLDKWLKVTRIFKTRTQANEACELNRVQVNDKEAKSAKLVKVGDKITVKFKLKKRSYDVLQLTNRSLPAASARLLYHEHELSAEEKETEEQITLFYRSSNPKYKGRPTKKDRRQLRDIRGH